jgi:hypothetical protein
MKKKTLHEAREASESPVLPDPDNNDVNSELLEYYRCDARGSVRVRGSGGRAMMEQTQEIDI